MRVCVQCVSHTQFTGELSPDQLRDSIGGDSPGTLIPQSLRYSKACLNWSSPIEPLWADS